jgi:hypothetical protein
VPGFRGLAGIQDFVDRLGFAKAGGGGAAADELASRRPPGDMLVAGGVVVADERHLADGDGEQVEMAGLGNPSQIRGVPSPRMVATRTTPGSSSRRRPSAASPG